MTTAHFRRRAPSLDIRSGVQELEPSNLEAPVGLAMEEPAGVSLAAPLTTSLVACSKQALMPAKGVHPFDWTKLRIADRFVWT